MLTDFPFICTSFFTLKLALFSMPCLSFGLLWATSYFTFRKNLLIQSSKSVNSRIPQTFSWKINWGLTLGHWSWKPSSFHKASTKVFYSLTQLEIYNCQDVMSANKWPYLFQIQGHWLLNKKTSCSSHFSGKKKGKAYWPIFLCNLVGAGFLFSPGTN